MDCLDFLVVVASLPPPDADQRPRRTTGVWSAIIHTCISLPADGKVDRFVRDCGEAFYGAAEEERMPNTTLLAIMQEREHQA